MHPNPSPTAASEKLTVLLMPLHKSVMLNDAGALVMGGDAKMNA